MMLRSVLATLLLCISSSDATSFKDACYILDCAKKTRCLQKSTDCYLGQCASMTFCASSILELTTGPPDCKKVLCSTGYFCKQGSRVCGDKMCDAAYCAREPNLYQSFPMELRRLSEFAIRPARQYCGKELCKRSDVCHLSKACNDVFCKFIPMCIPKRLAMSLAERVEKLKKLQKSVSHSNTPVHKSVNASKNHLQSPNPSKNPLQSPNSNTNYLQPPNLNTNYPQSPNSNTNYPQSPNTNYPQPPNSITNYPQSPNLNTNYTQSTNTNYPQSPNLNTYYPQSSNINYPLSQHTNTYYPQSPNTNYLQSPNTNYLQSPNSNTDNLQSPNSRTASLQSPNNIREASPVGMNAPLVHRPPDSGFHSSTAVLQSLNASISVQQLPKLNTASLQSPYNYFDLEGKQQFPQHSRRRRDVRSHLSNKSTQITATDGSYNNVIDTRKKHNGVLLDFLNSVNKLHNTIVPEPKKIIWGRQINHITTEDVQKQPNSGYKGPQSERAISAGDKIRSPFLPQQKMKRNSVFSISDHISGETDSDFSLDDRLLDMGKFSKKYHNRRHFKSQDKGIHDEMNKLLQSFQDKTNGSLPAKNVSKVHQPGNATRDMKKEINIASISTDKFQKSSNTDDRKQNASKILAGDQTTELKKEKMISSKSTRRYQNSSNTEDRKQNASKILAGDQTTELKKEKMISSKSTARYQNSSNTEDRKQNASKILAGDQITELKNEKMISSKSTGRYQNSSNTEDRKQNASKILAGEQINKNDSKESPNLRPTKDQSNYLRDGIRSETNQPDLPREIYNAGIDILLDKKAVQMILNHFKMYHLRDKDMALLEKLLLWRMRATLSHGKPQTLAVSQFRKEGNTSENMQDELEQKTKVRILDIPISNEKSRLPSTENKIKGEDLTEKIGDDRGINNKTTPSWEQPKSNLQDQNMSVQNMSTNRNHVIRELFDMLLEIPQVQHNIEKKKGVACNKHDTEHCNASKNEKLFQRNQDVLLNLSRGRVHLKILHHKDQTFNHSDAKNLSNNDQINKSQDNVYEQKNKTSPSIFTDINERSSFHSYKAKETAKECDNDGSEGISKLRGIAEKPSTSDDVKNHSIKNDSSSEEYHSLSKTRFSQSSEAAQFTQSTAKSAQKSHHTSETKDSLGEEKVLKETQSKVTPSPLWHSTSDDYSSKYGMVLQLFFENTSFPNLQGQLLREHDVVLTDKGSKGKPVNGQPRIIQNELGKRNDTQQADTGTRSHAKGESKAEYGPFYEPSQINTKFIDDVIQQRRQFKDNEISPTASPRQILEGNKSQDQQHQLAVHLVKIPHILQFHDLCNGTAGSSTDPLHRISTNPDEKHREEQAKESATSMDITKESARKNFSQVSSKPSHDSTKDKNYLVPRAGLNQEVVISLATLGKADIDNYRLRNKPDGIPLWSQFTKHSDLSSSVKNVEYKEKATYKQYIMKNISADTSHLPQYNRDNLPAITVPSNMTDISDDDMKHFKIPPTSTPQYSNFQEMPREKIMLHTNLPSSIVIKGENNSTPSSTLHNTVMATVKPNEIKPSNESMTVIGMHEDAQFRINPLDKEERGANTSQSADKSRIIPQMLKLNGTGSNKTDDSDIHKTRSDSDEDFATLKNKDLRPRNSNHTADTSSEIPVTESKKSYREETKTQSEVNETNASNSSSISPASSIAYTTSRKQRPYSLGGQRNEIQPDGKYFITEKNGELLEINPADSLSQMKSKPHLETWIDSPSDMIHNIDPKGAPDQRTTIPPSFIGSAQTNDYPKKPTHGNVVQVTIRNPYRNNQEKYGYTGIQQILPFEEVRAILNGGVPPQIYQNLRNQDPMQRSRKFFNPHRNPEEQGNYGKIGFEFGYIPQYFLPPSEGIIPPFRNVTQEITKYEPYLIGQQSGFVQPIDQYQWVEYGGMPQTNSKKLNEPELINHKMQLGYDNTPSDRIPSPMNPKQPMEGVEIPPVNVMQQNSILMPEVRQPSPEANRPMWPHLSSSLYGIDPHIGYYAQKSPAVPGDYGSYLKPSDPNFQVISREIVMNSNGGHQIPEPQNPHLEIGYYNVKKFNPPFQPNDDYRMLNVAEQTPRQRYPEAIQKFDFQPPYVPQQQPFNDKPAETESTDDRKRLSIDQVQYPLGGDGKKFLPFSTDNIQPNIQYEYPGQEKFTHGSHKLTRIYANRYEDIFPYVQKEREVILSSHLLPRIGDQMRLPRLVGNKSRAENKSINDNHKSKVSFVDDEVRIASNSSKEQQKSKENLPALNSINSSISNPNVTDTVIPESRQIKQHEWDENKILHRKEYNSSLINQTLLGHKNRTSRADKGVLMHTERYDRNFTQQLLLILKDQLFPNSTNTRSRKGVSSDCRSNKTIDANSTSITTNGKRSTAVVSSKTETHQSNNNDTNENIGQTVKETEPQHLNGSKTNDTTTSNPRMHPPRTDEQFIIKRQILHEVLMPSSSQKESNRSSDIIFESKHHSKIVEEPRTVIQDNRNPVTMTTTSKYVQQNETKAREGGRKEESNHFAVDRAKSPEIHSQNESKTITALLEKVKNWKNNIVRISNDRYAIKD